MIFLRRNQPPLIGHQTQDRLYKTYLKTLVKTALKTISIFK
jgi:hypothetical protein